VHQKNFLLFIRHLVCGTIALQTLFSIKSHKKSNKTILSAMHSHQGKIQTALYFKCWSVQIQINHPEPTFKVIIYIILRAARLSPAHV